MTTYQAGTRGDGLRLKKAGSEVYYHAAAGAVSGVTVLAASGANGPGVGTLRSDGQSCLQWKAPGSSTFGTAIYVPANGSYVLEDGDSAAAWIRVQVAQSFLVNAQDALVFVQDTFNGLGPDDVSAAEATAGAVESTEYALENATLADVLTIKVWLDASTSGLEISDDGAAWVSPTTEGSALALGNLAPGGTVALHTRRTIGAGAGADADVINLLHASWTGL